MRKISYDKAGVKTLAAVINRAYKDLCTYNETARDELERQILAGSLDLYFGMFEMKITPKYFIEKAREERESKPARKRKKGII